MNKFIVHLNLVESFSMKADSIYDVEKYINQDLHIQTGYCITQINR